MSKISPSDELCIKEYVTNGGNKTAAYRAVFKKKVARWKPETIHNKASAFFRRDEIQARLEEISNTVQKETCIDAEYVLRRLHAIESFSLLSLFDDSGDIKPVEEWPPEAAEIVVGLDITKTYSAGKGDQKKQVEMKKLKLESRIKALELMGKHVSVQAFQDKKLFDAGSDMLNFMDRISDSPMGSPQARIANREKKPT